MIIGITSLNDECIFCNMPSHLERYLNEITMDLLMRRHTMDELVKKWQTFFPTLQGELAAHHFTFHASHCDVKAVPDEYVINPTKYEGGEKAGE